MTTIWIDLLSYGYGTACLLRLLSCLVKPHH